MTRTQTYIAKAAGWIAGRYLKKGDPIPLTPDAAKYENVAPPAPRKRRTRKGAS
ncbi:hypothetical protein [Roseinatronobacter sp. NSM]|uniref:hypothetical protein n=1 Tax=Roseinatronobacter sp. NSM TaxID=3457785 RepID=UPI0040365684